MINGGITRVKDHDARSATGEAMETVAVVIPTLNEESSIGKVIGDVPFADLLKNGLKTVVYVIDGQSTDKTREIAKTKGAHIVLEEANGKGTAIQTAFGSIEADYFLMIDGDDTYPIDVAPQMIDLLQTHDVVIGSRLKGTIERGAMTKLNIVGNRLLTILARLLFHAHISDVCTGLWGFRSETIRRLDLVAQGFELEADMYAECAIRGCSIAEIPITYRARADKPKLSSVDDGLNIGTFMIRKWWQHQFDKGRK